MLVRRKSFNCFVCSLSCVSLDFWCGFSKVQLTISNNKVWPLLWNITVLSFSLVWRRVFSCEAIHMNMCSEYRPIFLRSNSYEYVFRIITDTGIQAHFLVIIAIWKAWTRTRFETDTKYLANGLLRLISDWKHYEDGRWWQRPKLPARWTTTLEKRDLLKGAVSRGFCCFRSILC